MKKKKRKRKRKEKEGRRKERKKERGAYARSLVDIAMSMSATNARIMSLKGPQSTVRTHPHVIREEG